MAPALRRLLRKASLDEVKKEEADLAPLQRSNSDDTLTQAHVAKVHANPVPQLDSSKRRPTPEFVNSLRLHPPDKEIVNPRELRKQKGKLPISKFAIPPPPRPLSSRRTKRDPISDRELFELSTGETGKDPVPKVKRVQVQGQEFEMIVTDADNGNISAPVEDGDNRAEMESSNRRITRYGGRRPSVAESKQEDIDNVSTRDFAPKPVSEGLQVPPLKINKKAINGGDKPPTRIPSPRSSPRSPGDTPPIPPPKDTEITRDICPDPITTEPEYTHQPLLHSGAASSPSPAPSSTGSSSSFSARTVKKFGFHTKQRAEARSSETRAPSLTTPFIPKDVPVVVRPPTYNMNLHAGLQWCEAGKTSSRASAPW
ncbi:hypothetical protein CERZMDRAFT_94645 [Cercospora zeae-maydis SCOH1-5]|uniref:Uncharacterized protein n=1 Tax=Cercospora zeae-maydis SCOH1-5 TaxID=717836 RepID=A0A6A6FPG5_9PEZI|nr:hypothetical protein CERZMDRAFT_94645 [Cercospora zeae-maydis SCOH1-5]